MRHPQMFPLEVNRAEWQQLVRVPGIGPKSAVQLLKVRSKGRVRTLRDLKQLGAEADRAAPFILLDGKRPPYQLPMWDSAAD